jgi:hypothetical protein
MRFIEALKKLNEMDELVPVKKETAVVVSDDLNAKLLKKIEMIADALAHAFEQEGITLDAALIADDIRRDCGLMGDVISTDELDVEHNPFDAATKQMHDMGPVDTNIACQTLLNVSPHEFVQVFLTGLKRNRGLLPPGAERRVLPHRPMPRRIGEAKEKDYSYINELSKKFSAQIEESLKEEILDEKITDLKAYYNSSKNKDKFKELGLSERDFMRLADIDPTHKEGTNGGGTYIEWLLRLITSGTTTFREMQQAAHEYKDQLSAYEDLKKRKRLPENKRDIMQIKSLAELMHVVVTRGEEEEPKEAGEEGGEDKTKSSGSMSDFKQDLKDFPALCQKLTWPDKVEGTYEDHMELVGENDKWEVWKIKSPLGAFIFDQWGDGAKWCVGGFGYKGADGKRSAENYYPNYLHNGEGVYVCFQQKNKNAPRPNNKALITFNDKARYSVSQFNHANNGSYYSGGYSSDTAAEFARFLSEENLLNVLKGTEFGNCESIKDVETAERLKNGEPYVYGGEKVKNQFKEAIKKVVFEEGYSRTVKLRKQDQAVELIGIPENAFRDCKNLEEVDMPIEIQAIGFHAFLNCDKAIIKTPRHRISCFPQDVDYINKHMIYTDDPVKEEPKPEGNPEDNK